MQNSILQYIPQRPPFVMIDTLEIADEHKTQTSFTIRDGHLFVEDGNFTEPGLIENMAQAAAAGTGSRARAIGSEPVIGFIGALKGLSIKHLPRIGEKIQTEITFLHQVLNAHIVQAIITCDGREIASCELKIFLQT